MKLTEQHIENLYKFTRQHYVYHYDVQSELVDHLANDIEQIWEEYPKTTFEQARDKSFKKFGIFGFMDVIEAKQKQMNKRYWKIIIRFVKEWFSIPKIIATTSLFLAIFFTLKINYTEYILLGAILLLFTYNAVKQIRERKISKEKKEKQEKTFLLEAMIGETRNGFSGFVFVHVFNSINLIRIPFSELEDHWLAIIAASATLLIILFYVTSYLIPQKAEELLQETYPEYKMVKNL